YSYNMVLPQPRTGSLDEGILTAYKVLLTLLETCSSSTNYQDSYILPIGFTNHNFVLTSSSLCSCTSQIQNGLFCSLAKDCVCHYPIKHGYFFFRILLTY